MGFFQTYSKELVALLVPFLTWLINTKLKPRARISIATLHRFAFLVQQPIYDEKGVLLNSSQTAQTQSLVIKNDGKDTATKIEVVLNWEPIVNIWPIRSYEGKKDKDGRYIMIFDSLSPSETIGIELLSINNELPALITVRCNECLGHVVPMTYYPIAPVWKIRLFMTLAFFGFVATIYSAIILIQFLVLKTPVVLGGS